MINLTGPSKPKEEKSSQMYIKTPSVASIADLIKISNRTAAAIVNAALQDFGIINEEDKISVIECEN